jgi:hypothetical protein
VSTLAPPSDHPETPRSRGSWHLAITDGEAHFLWVIMTPETWDALLGAYGLRERHVWVHLSVEMWFRKRHFLGPVIPYRASVEQSAQAIQTCQRIGLRSPRWLRRGKGSCFLCALNTSHGGAGAAAPTRLDRGPDSSGLRSFAIDLPALWRPRVCTAACAGEVSGLNRCRPHLIPDLKSHRPVSPCWTSCACDSRGARNPLWRKPTRRLMRPHLFRRLAGAAAGIPCSRC